MMFDRAALDGLRLGLWRLRDSVRDRAFGTKHRRRVFGRIFADNLWGDPESPSGGGSSLPATESVRVGLPALLRRHAVQSLLDAPCGDFSWMQEVVPAVKQYVGVDIVPDLIARNTALYRRAGVSFVCADIVADSLPAADLILCRDCFIHLSTRLIRKALINFRSTGAPFLLLTHDVSASEYHDIAVGSFRPINFMKPPFSFPLPLDQITEGAEGRQLCLWDLQTLEIPTSDH